VTITLEDLGWSAAFAAGFEEYRANGWVPARVSLEHTHIYRVLTPEGERLARVSGRLRHRAEARSQFPAVGDWVAIEERGTEDARIHAVLPRRTRFSRRAAGDVTQEQVVAANVDVVFLVSGLDNDFNPRRIERYLLTAWDSGASPVIVLNKTDLVDDVRPFVDEIAPLAAGVPVVGLSAHEAHSLAPLRAFLEPGRTGALLGSSGVGKSSIARASLEHGTLKHQAKHFFYAAGWKKFERAWNLVIRARQLRLMTPLLEAVLAKVTALRAPARRSSNSEGSLPGAARRAKAACPP
jgi:ribosome biogenesis GTPase